MTYKQYEKYKVSLQVIKNRAANSRKRAYGTRQKSCQKTEETRQKKLASPSWHTRNKAFATLHTLIPILSQCSSSASLALARLLVFHFTLSQCQHPHRWGLSHHRRSSSSIPAVLGVFYFYFCSAFELCICIQLSQKSLHMHSIISVGILHIYRNFVNVFDHFCAAFEFLIFVLSNC